MKKHLIFLSALFFLVGCEGTNTFEPSEGGTYDQTTDKADLIDKLARIESLGAVTAPSEIKVGETLDTKDVSVVANYVNAEYTTQPIEPDEVELDTSVAGDQTGVVIVHCKVDNFEYSLTATFSIKVVEEEAETPKTPVEITGVVFNKQYVLGDIVSLEDIDLTVKFDDDTSETVHPTSIELDTSELGPVTATIHYGTLKQEVGVTISNETQTVTLISLELISEVPAEIAKGGVLPFSNIKLKAIYSDGSFEEVYATGVELDTSSAGTATGKFYYNGLAVGFDIEVVDSGAPVVVMTGIEVTNAPNSVNIGDSITASEVDITVKYSDNSVELAKPTSIDFTPPTAAGTAFATVHYNGFDAQFVVTVIDPNAGGEDEEEEEVLMCTYRIYFSYSHTTKYNPDTKKDVDSPLLSFTAPMLKPLGAAPSDIAKDSDPTKVDSAKVIALGTQMGFTIDPAFPNFLGFSKYGICLTDAQLWDFTKDYQQQAVVSLYGVWVD